LKFKDKIFYGWIVTGAFLAIGTMLWGVRLSYGIFFKSIEAEFNLSRAATSSIFSVHLALGVVFALLGGWALDRFGPKIVILVMGLLTALSLLLTSQTDSFWQLFLTYSLLLSLGSSATYAVITSTISRWFDKKRGLALGIATAGVGLGTVVMAPLSTFLISHLDWRTAFLVLGIISLVIVVPLSWLLKREPREIGALPDGVKSESIKSPKVNREQIVQAPSLSLVETLRTRSFWLILFIFLCIALTFFIITTHLVPHATDIGISAEDAAVVLSLQGIMLVIGRIVLGIISDKLGRKKTAIVCTLLEVAAMTWLIWANNLWGFYLFAIVFGFAYGGTGPAITSIAGDAFGLRHIGTIIGMLEIGFGIGATIGPAIGGFIFDVTQNYTMAFLLGAGIMLLATILIFPVGREIHAHNKHRALTSTQ